VSSNVAPDVHGVTISALNLRPRSRGEIRLRGANPDDAAIFNGNYLKEPADVEHLSRGVQFVRQIVRAPAFADLGAREMLPGPALPDDPSALMDYVRRSARTVYHPTGTCRMGVDEDAVVDPRLRVHGLDRLWVADASVMPTITSGNTHAPTVMIAERAAKFILDS
jgi:choline dehydrogenase-like flavoprotein